MENGFIKLWRKSLNSRVFNNEGLWKVWTWCLLKASHKKRWYTMKTGKSEIEIELLPGQFVYGRHSASKALKMKPSTVRNRMEKLSKLQNLDIKKDNQYSIISIINWESYQPKKKKKDSKEDNQRTIKGQSKDTNKNVETVKNEENLLGKYKKSMPVPDNYSIQPEHLKYAESKNISKEDARDQFEAFILYFKSTGKLKKDWYATYQVWIRNAISYKKITPQIKNQTEEEIFG